MIATPLTSFSSALRSRVEVVRIFPFDIGEIYIRLVEEGLIDTRVQPDVPGWCTVLITKARMRASYWLDPYRYRSARSNGLRDINSIN